MRKASFLPHELYLIYDQFAVGRRVEFLTNAKAIDLLRYITTSFNGAITASDIPNIISVLGDTNLITVNMVAQLYGDPNKREKTPRLLTSIQVKDIVDSSLPSETPARRNAIAAFLVFILVKQGLIEEKKTLAIDAVYKDPFVVTDMRLIEQDIILTKMAKAIDAAASKKITLKMGNVLTLAESLREIFRTYREAVYNTVTRAPYLNTLYSLVAKGARGELDDLYLDTPAYVNAKHIINFYVEPDKFSEIPFEFSTVSIYDKNLYEYFLDKGVSRFGLINLTNIAAMFSIERFVHSEVHEIFSMIIRRNLDSSINHAGLMDYFRHDNLYIYSPVKDAVLSQVEKAVISEDNQLIKSLLSSTHSLKMNLEPNNREVLVHMTPTQLELKLLALACADRIIVTSTNRDRRLSHSLAIEFSTNSNIVRDVYTEILINPNLIKHSEGLLLDGDTVKISGDESLMTTNSILYPLLYSTKNGGNKPFQTKTESVEKFAEKSIFLNEKHTSVLSDKPISATLRYIDLEDKLSVVKIELSPADLLATTYNLEWVAALANLRNQVVNEQDAIALSFLQDVMSDSSGSITEPTRAVLVRNIRRAVRESLLRLNSTPWLKTLAGEIILRYNVPITRAKVMNTPFNKLSALTTAYAIMYEFLTGRKSLLEQLVVDYFTIDLGILSQIDIQDLVL